jgi:putative transposase
MSISFDAVEVATLTSVDWFRTRRLLALIGYVPPAEYEVQHYAQCQPWRSPAVTSGHRR